VTDDGSRGSALGTTLAAIGAFAIGAVAGMAIGGAMGAVHGGRMRETLGRLRRPASSPSPDALQQAVLDALRQDEATGDLDIHVQVMEGGLVELTGVVSDATLRRIAGDLARSVPGVQVVVNRIMTRGGTGTRPGPTLRPV
jgi:osmotically-inducible protein OsmY